MSKLLQDVAYSMGVEAFKAGKPRIPASDKSLLKDVITGCKVGESIPYLKSWLIGWDDSNLYQETEKASAATPA